MLAYWHRALLDPAWQYWGRYSSLGRKTTGFQRINLLKVAHILALAAQLTHLPHGPSELCHHTDSSYANTGSTHQKGRWYPVSPSWHV